MDHLQFRPHDIYYASAVCLVSAGRPTVSSIDSSKWFVSKNQEVKLEV
jgi:hypothetical protein